MLKPLFLAMFSLAFLKQSHAQAAAHEDVSSTIIAMERDALNRSDKGDIERFLEISDPEVTYFDPFLKHPIYGLEALRDYYRQMPMTETGEGVMTNAKVQAYGDVAVLTFNYVSKLHNPERVFQWNTTEVYRRTSAGWRIVHTHWALQNAQLPVAKEG